MFYMRFLTYLQHLVHIYNIADKLETAYKTFRNQIASIILLLIPLKLQTANSFSLACLRQRVAVFAIDFNYCSNKTRSGFDCSLVEIGSRG